MFEVVWSTIPFTTAQWYGINYSIPIVDNFEEGFSVFNMFELILLAPSISLLTYFIVFINSISLFHRNISILFNYALCWVIFGYFGKFYILLIRLKLVDAGISETLLFLSSFLRFECYGNVMTLQWTLVGERIFATYFVSDYEKKHRTWINFIVLPLNFLVAQTYTLSLLFLQPVVIIPLSYCILMTVCSFFVLHYLYSSNFKKFQYMQQNPMAYTLSKKFQLEENLKVMWYFRGILFTFICMNSSIAVLYFTPTIISIKSTVRLVDIAVILVCIIVPVGMFCAMYHNRHPAFLRHHRWLFGDDFGRNRVMPRAINETSLYFSQLEELWK